VAAMARRQNMSERKLAVYFRVRPDLIEQALRSTDQKVNQSR